MSNEHLSNFWERNRILIKGFIIGFLIVVMLIPFVFIMSLVNERKNRQAEVIREVSSKWAGEQTIKGPLLLIPYKEFITSADGKTLTAVKKTAYLLPDELKINSRLSPEKRHRSLFDVILYRSNIELSGTFNTQALTALQIPNENILWQEAEMVIGISDVRGLEEEIQLQWQDSAVTMEGGVPDNTTVKEGLNAPITIAPASKKTFKANISLRGSGYLYFTPVGKITEVAMQAPWKDPAFDGNYLPTQNPVITDKGFTANWKILPVSRQYPQCWKDNTIDIEQSAFGVKLIQPVDGYAKTERSVKYAILFIALTFAIFFFLEILLKRNIQPLQYLLVGLALIVFYTLLLSISEYTGFNIAYLVATAATVLLIGIYVSSIFNSRKTGAFFTLALAVLYTYIFILIQLQDYALLCGSIGLFLIIAIMMYYSRKIDWHATSSLTKNKTNDAGQ